MCLSVKRLKYAIQPSTFNHEQEFQKKLKKVKMVETFQLNISSFELCFIDKRINDSGLCRTDLAKIDFENLNLWVNIGVDTAKKYLGSHLETLKPAPSMRERAGPQTRHRRK
jgi:hypothetical protein